MEPTGFSLMILNLQRIQVLALLVNPLPLCDQGCDQSPKRKEVYDFMFRDFMSHEVCLLVLSNPELASSSSQINSPQSSRSNGSPFHISGLCILRGWKDDHFSPPIPDIPKFMCTRSTDHNSP
jgi:hypothetical protein